MAKIVIFLGQSNSEGAELMANLQAEYKTTFSTIKTWVGTSWESLNYLLGNNKYPDLLAYDSFGVQFSLMKKLQAYFNETIYMISYNIGGVGLGFISGRPTYFDCTVRGNAFDAAVSTINNALGNLWASGVRSYDFYFIWQDGETDATDATTAAAFQANMVAFVNAMRANLSGTALANSRKCWITNLCGGNIADIPTVGTRPYCTTVKAAEIAATAQLSDAYYLDVDGFQLQAGSVHFDATGYDDMGTADKNLIVSIQ